MRLEIGRYIVVDDEVCHGKPVFRGTGAPLQDEEVLIS
jgi:uncharacterized protein (DUF433 family)